MNDAAHYAAAWRDRKRRMLVFKATQFAGLPIILGAVYLSSSYPGLPHLLPKQGLLVIPAWSLAYIAAGIWLNRFPCPRCGQLFYWRLEIKGYLQRQKNWRNCRHCGLQEDTLPT